MLAAAPLLLALNAETPFVLAVGANAPSLANLAPLSFADDDAAGAAALFGANPGRTWLLTELDADSQDRFAGLAALARPPTVVQLRGAVREMAARIGDAADRGEQPVVIAWLVGHGAFDGGGQPFLALQDGALSSTDLVKDVIAPMQRAHRVHVIIDACHAEALVQWRAQIHAVEPASVEKRFFGADLVPPGNVGFLVASGAGEKTFEWAEMRAGVFSALARAGLRGAANVNGDDRVTYDELTAYVLAALQGVPLPDARPRIAGRPPGVERTAPLSQADWFKGAAVFATDRHALGPVHVVDARGNWLAGGRFEAGHEARLWLPQEAGMVLTGADGEWALDVGQAQQLSLGQRFDESDTRARGPVERALKEGLFSIPFGPSYARGYEAARAQSAVTMPPGAIRPVPARRHLLRLASIPAWVVAAGWSGAAVMATGLAGFHTADFLLTDLQRPAALAARNAGLAALGAVVCLTLAAGAALLAMVLLLADLRFG
jgi:hypothetical protein